MWIGAAKNDPRKKGRELYVPRLAGTELCAVAALERWLEAVGAVGAVFRTFDLRGRLTENRIDAGDVARVLRRRAVAGGASSGFCGAFVAAGVYHERCKEKGPDRKY